MSNGWNVVKKKKKSVPQREIEKEKGR